MSSSPAILVQDEVCPLLMSMLSLCTRRFAAERRKIPASCTGPVKPISRRSQEQKTGPHDGPVCLSEWGLSLRIASENAFGDKEEQAFHEAIPHPFPDPAG